MRLRFSIKWLFLLLLLAALICAAMVRVRQQGRRQREFELAGQEISGFHRGYYDYETTFGSGSWSFEEKQPPHWDFVYQWFPAESLHQIVAVEILYPDGGADALAPLAKLPTLRGLKAEMTRYMDDEVDHLLKFQQLEYLDLEAGNMTDKGVLRLAELRRLRVLDLHGSYVTDDGIQALRKKMPYCVINGKRHQGK